MILINLLPHREMARERGRQAFNGALGAAALVGAAIAGVIYLWYQNEIDTQQGRNGFLRQEIAKLDKEIAEIVTLRAQIAALKARQQAVEDLQTGRNLPVHLLNEAALQLPEGVFLREIKQQDKNVLLSGVAQSNERVSELLRNLSGSSEWISSPELVEIVAANLAVGPRDTRRVYNFTIRVQLGQRTKAASDAAAAAPAPAK